MPEPVLSGDGVDGGLGGARAGIRKFWQETDLAGMTGRGGSGLEDLGFGGA